MLCRLVTQRCDEMRLEAGVAGGGAAAPTRRWTVAPLFAGLNARPAANFIQPIKFVLHSHAVNLANVDKSGRSRVTKYCTVPHPNATEAPPRKQRRAK